MIQRMRDVGVMLVTVAPPFYFLGTYSGPFEWMAEFQLKQWGSYDEKLTLILLVVAWMGMLAGIYRLLRIANPSLPSTEDLSSRDFAQRLERAALVAAPFIVFFVGVYLWFSAQGMKAPQPFPLAAYAAGGSLPSHYVTLEDVELLEQEEGMTERSTTKWYVPVVPRGSADGQEVQAFLEFKDRARQSFKPDAPLVGMVSYFGLPGLVRNAFGRDGIQPGRRHLVIELGETPKRTEFASYFMMGLAVVLAGVAWWRARKERLAAS